MFFCKYKNILEISIFVSYVFIEEVFSATIDQHCAIFFLFYAPSRALCLSQKDQVKDVYHPNVKDNPPREKRDRSGSHWTEKMSDKEKRGGVLKRKQRGRAKESADQFDAYTQASILPSPIVLVPEPEFLKRKSGRALSAQ